MILKSSRKALKIHAKPKECIHFIYKPISIMTANIPISIIQRFCFYMYFSFRPAILWTSSGVVVSHARIPLYCIVMRMKIKIWNPNWGIQDMYDVHTYHYPTATATCSIIMKCSNQYAGIHTEEGKNIKNLMKLHYRSSLLADGVCVWMAGWLCSALLVNMIMWKGYHMYTRTTNSDEMLKM